MTNPVFPPEPIAPAQFLEEWYPAAFAAAELPPGADQVDVRLGILLEGEGGGEWTLHIAQGELRVIPGSRADAAFTYVQHVEDWRGTLWEGRGGSIGEGTAQLFRPGSQPAAAEGPGLSAAPSLAALSELEKLQGLLRMVVTGAESGDWSVAMKLGPGEIPSEPTTTVTVSAEDAAAMASGELDPMAAFMSGRIRVEGDMTLMMQMQAIQMQAMAANGAGGDEAGS